MMGHWADDYVGLPGEGESPCWALVRQVFRDRTGFDLPNPEAGADEARTIAREAEAFVEVMAGEERDLDLVVMNTDVRCGLAWVRAAAHIGIVVGKGLALHVERNRLAAIEPIAKIDVARVLRHPVLALRARFSSFRPSRRLPPRCWWTGG